MKNHKKIDKKKKTTKRQKIVHKEDDYVSVHTLKLLKHRFSYMNMNMGSSFLFLHFC